MVEPPADPPPEPITTSRADRREQERRTKRRRRRRIVTIVVGVLVIAAIVVGAIYLFTRSDDHSPSTTTTTTTSTPGYPTTARAASEALLAAWKHKDRDAAAAVATPGAIDQIFAIDTAESDGLAFGACTVSGADQRCVWSRPGGALTFTASPAGTGYRITAVEFGPAGLPPESSTSSGSTAPPTSGSTSTLPAPSDPEGFAQNLFGYWKVGDRTNAALVATNDAVGQMFSVSYPGDPNPYTFQGCRGVGGNAQCTFTGTGVPTITMTVPIAGGGVPVPVANVQRAN